MVKTSEKHARVGFLHIPKTAGASLNSSIFAALGMRPFHVANFLRKGDESTGAKPKEIREGTLAFSLACAVPYLPGHVTYSDLQALGRDFVFTVLRDPRKRAISMYTYALKRANSEIVVRRRPALKRFKDMDFYQFIQEPSMERSSMATMLLSDFEDFHQAAMRGSIGRQDADRIEQALSRLNAIYACSNQTVLDDLHGRGLIPAAKEVVKNLSDGTVRLAKLGSRQQFLETLDRVTASDRLIYEIAAERFPQYVSAKLAGDDDLIADIEARFGAVFAD
jgi:hypothetical protein